MIFDKLKRGWTRISLIGFAGLLAMGASNSVIAAEDDESMEEVVVTGTYLRRSAADSPSPLSVMTSADIEDIGAADIAEVISSMPWNSGSQTRAATFQGEGADGRNTINLRNLGNASTLPLVNGRRHVPSWYNGRGNASTNINALVPTIAVERIEVVKDGASALYGSDAVAGVVNFITKMILKDSTFPISSLLTNRPSKVTQAPIVLSGACREAEVESLLQCKSWIATRLMLRTTTSAMVVVRYRQPDNLAGCFPSPDKRLRGQRMACSLISQSALTVKHR
jgi:hypothetical protein